MSDAYRDEHEAALRHLDALRRENEELREALARQREPDGPSARPSAALALAAGALLMVGAMTGAGASSQRCASRRPSSHPCPYASAQRGGETGESAFERGERLLRNEPGMIRVELAHGNELAQVRVDGIEIPRSGALALSGPLAGGATHVVDVSAGGFIQSRSRVWVTPGRTEVVRVALTVDPAPKPVDEEKRGED